MYDCDISRGMGMGIYFIWPSMRRPSGMTYSNSARYIRNDFFKINDPAFFLMHFNGFAIEDRNPCRVISTVLQSLEGINNYRSSLPFPFVPYYSAHAIPR